jgi:hypothetical protein|tara:strand:- start:366 stop:527 length:162 start_codon:yes stop_codon:yes gene_type:complete
VAGLLLSSFRTWEFFLTQKKALTKCTKNDSALESVYEFITTVNNTSIKVKVAQ